MNIVKSFNNKVFAEHSLKKELKQLSLHNKSKIAHDIREQKQLIKVSDAIIIESTYPSIGIGYIIAYSLGQHKNVLVLYQKTPHAVLISENNRLLTLKKYDVRDRRHLTSDLKNFLQTTNQKTLKYRFNMMIDKYLDDLLNLESQKLHVSKADYVRQLIYEKLASSRNG